MEVVTRANILPRTQFYGDFQGTRKLLQSKMNGGEVPAPSPTQCTDMTTGVLVNCKNPPHVVIIIGGMSCMLFLITITLVLLIYSFQKERRRRQRMQGDNAESSRAGSGERPAAVDIPGQYDSAVLVQFPGDDKPHFFALPAPFAGQGKDAEKIEDMGGSDDGDGKAVEKKNDELPAEEPVQDFHDELGTQPQLSTDDVHRPPCVLEDDGSYRNPLFMPV